MLEDFNDIPLEILKNDSTEYELIETSSPRSHHEND